MGGTLQIADRTHRFDWLPATLAGLAFVGFLAAFCWELSVYQRRVVDWARRDLQSRADLAAANLEEPLRTQDFRRIHEAGRTFDAEGIRLTVTGSGGGRIFDTRLGAGADEPCYSCSSRRGECRVTLSLPSRRVLAPFYRSLVGVGLAALVGVAGVVLFFLVTYRQRVRIRELARLEKFRRDFIADVSHEIKTPLTGILGAVDLLEDETLPAESRKRLAGMAKGEANRLHALVQGILSLARLEREGDVLSLRPTDAGALVRETVEALEPLAERAGVTLAVSLPEPLPILSADAALLSQALKNLLVNAIRHSGAKTVRTSVAAVGGAVRFAVEDSGTGIAPEHRARLFERFYRPDASRAAATGGAGLGLAIVRQIARLHGGDAVYEPVEPSGSRFVLLLPKGKESVR